MSDEFLTLGLPFGSFSDLSKEIAETEDNLQTVPRSRRSRLEVMHHQSAKNLIHRVSSGFLRTPIRPG
jgi:hypothetical protein